MQEIFTALGEIKSSKDRQAIITATINRTLDQIPEEERELLAKSSENLIKGVRAFGPEKRKVNTNFGENSAYEVLLFLGLKSEYLKLLQE